MNACLNESTPLNAGIKYDKNLISNKSHNISSNSQEQITLKIMPTHREANLVALGKPLTSKADQREKVFDLGRKVQQLMSNKAEFRKEKDAFMRRMYLNYLNKL